MYRISFPVQNGSGATHSPIQWVPGALSLGVKRPGREAHHSPLSSAEIKECVELYLHFPNTSSWRGAQLKHRNNCTFTFAFFQSSTFDETGKGAAILNQSN
jgi:hypothetical protein